ncbi:MAG: MBG domain-containing protein, partial [Clostridia bacterium]
EEVTASAQMTINRILPQISFSSLTPLTQTYSHYTPIIAYAGGVFGDGFYQEISVVTEFADEQPNAGSYAISTHFEGSTNYLPRQTEGTLIIAPKAIPVAFNPQWEYIYTGKPHSRTLQYDKDAFPSDLVIDVTYDGEPYGIECGVYQIALSANNPNYYLTYSLADLKMDIKKASLTIRLNNVVIMPGQDAQITYTYIGFVEGEGSEVLTALPRLTNRPTEPGVYQLVPQDAEAKNYTFNYMPGNYTVNQHSVTGELQNSDIKVLVTSSFHPGSAINFSKIDKDSESFTGLSSILRDRSQIYFNSDIVGAYNFNFSEGGLSGTNEYKASIFNVKLSPLFKHNIAVVDKGGNYHKIDNYVYKDNTIVFNFHVEGRIVIYRYSLLTYLVAGFIGLGALIIIIYKISSAISYRRTKKGEPEEQLVPQTPPPTKPRYDW